MILNVFALSGVAGILISLLMPLHPTTKAAIYKTGNTTSTVQITNIDCTNVCSNHNYPEIDTPLCELLPSTPGININCVGEPTCCKTKINYCYNGEEMYICSTSCTEMLFIPLCIGNFYWHVEEVVTYKVRFPWLLFKKQPLQLNLSCDVIIYGSGCPLPKYLHHDYYLALPYFILLAISILILFVVLLFRLCRKREMSLPFTLSLPRLFRTGNQQQ